jgi:hypothetical protein
MFDKGPFPFTPDAFKNEAKQLDLELKNLNPDYS